MRGLRRVLGRRRHQRRGRGQASVVGYALMTGLVVMAVTTALVVGTVAIGGFEDSAQLNRAETAMTKLDAEIAVVALDSDRPRTVDFGGFDGHPRTVHDSGRITVTMTNLTTGTTTTLADASLGAVVYEHDGTTIAYQGGGVWRSDATGSRMVSPPEFHYRDATLTLPIIQVEGTASGGPDRLTVRKLTPLEQPFPNAALSRVNPLVEQKVTVTVQSQFYESWGRFFVSRTDGEVDYDHANRAVTVTLVSPLERPPLQDALFATAPGGELKFTGTDARSDSYDSAAGDYAATKGGDGTIRIAGDLDARGNVDILGDVVTAGDVELGGSARVEGDVRYAGSLSASGSYTVTGSYENIEPFDGVDDVNTLVSTRVADAAAENDNGDTTAISGSTLAGGDVTLTPGTYYLTHLTLGDGETLTVDNSGGSVAIAVEDYVELTGAARIELTDPDGGVVRVFVGGQDATRGYHLYLDKSGGSAPQITVPGDRSTQFWIYGKDDMRGFVRGASGSRATLTGVVFAPAGEGGTGHLSLKHADVYGGLVGATVEVGNRGGIHYDRALVYESSVPKDASIIPVSYLHVTVNRVAVGQGSAGGPANALPVADAGTGAAIDEGGSVSLDGTGSSDPDGSVASYAWTITNGPGSLSSADTASPTYVAPADVAADQTVTVQLTVTDDGGATATDAVQVTVRDTDSSNAAPLADAGTPVSVVEGGSVSLDGSGSSDADGSVAGYQWSLANGPGSLTDADTASPTYVAPADVTGDQTATVQLTVTDGDGATDADTVDVTVLDGAGVASPTIETFGVADMSSGNDVEYRVDFSASGPGSIEVTIRLVRADNGQIQDTFARTYPGGSSGDVTTTLFGGNDGKDHRIEIVVDDGTNQATDSVTDTPDGTDP